MRAVFDRAKVIVDGGETFLCLAVPHREAVQFCAQMEGKKYVAELRPYQKRRSLSANAYFWTLLDKLAGVLQTGKEELYLAYIRQYGLFKDFTLAPDEARTFCHAWEMLGTGWPTQQLDYDADGERVVIRAYYGSSTYTARRMARLINAVAEDCRAQGIDTLTPQELARLTCR